MIRKIHTHLSKAYSQLALLSAEMVVVLAAFFCSMILVVVTVQQLFLKHREGLDHIIFRLVSNTVSPTKTDIMQFITFFGSHHFLIPAYLFLIFWFLFVRKHKWYSIKIPAIAISSLVLMMLLKQFFNRPRPAIPLLHEVGGLSFPSGHAFMSFSFFGLLIYMSYKYVPNKNLKWAFIAGLMLWILLIGYSRIYLRVHYASDVAAGFALGLMWLVISLWVLRRMEKFSQRNLVPDKTATATVKYYKRK